MTRAVAVLSDVHGNAAALDGGPQGDQAREARRRRSSPATTSSTARTRPARSTPCARWRPSGATIVQGNTDVAVADFDYARRVPVVDRRRAGHDPRRRRVGPRRARRRAGRLAPPAAVRAPPDARRHDGPRLPRLARLADPGLRRPARPVRRPSSGSRGPTPGSSAAATPTCPEVRDLGWKMIVNDGSAGYVFDGDPTASWALVEVDGDEVRAEIRRTEFDTMAVANAISARGLRRRRLPGRDGPHREARPMTGEPANADWPAAPRRVVVTGMGMLTALGNDVASTWAAMVAGRSGVAHDHAVRPVAARRARVAGEVKDFDASHVLDKKDMRRTDRYIQFGLVAAREAMDQAGLPARLEGERGRADRGHPRDRARRRRDARRRDHDQRPARPGPDQPVPHPDGHPERRRRPDRDQLRDDRPELHDRVGLRDRRPRDRRGVGDDPPRRRRDDDRGRRRGRASTSRSSAASTRCARCRAGTTTRRAPRGRSTSGRDGFVPGEGAGARRPRGARARPGPRRDDPRRAHRLRRDRRRVAHHAARAGRDRRRAGGASGRSRKAGLEPADIDHVNAHATSTPEGDKAELQAIRTIFGEHAGRSRSPPTSR